MVPKLSGGWRPCRDFRCLNASTTSDRYPVPHIQDFTANLAVREFSQRLIRFVVTTISLCTQTISPRWCNLSVQSMGVPTHASLPQECSTNVSKTDRHSPSRGLDFIFVYLDDIRGQPIQTRTQSTCTTSTRVLTTAGPRHQFGQMPVRPTGNRFSWPPYHQTECHTSTFQGSCHQGSPGHLLLRDSRNSLAW